MKDQPGQKFIDGSVACLSCGRRLKSARSIEARRGPACAKKRQTKKQRTLFPKN
jgi:Family of unknown function (DUF6011)